MNKFLKLILLCAVCLTATTASAQQRRISGTVSDDFDVVPGANVVERDKNNRIISATVTDMNGHFTLAIKDPKNTLNVTFMGLKPYSKVIGNQNTWTIKLQDNTKTMTEVKVTAKKRQQSGGLSIPVRELAGATQTLTWTRWKVWPSNPSIRPCKVRLQVSTSCRTPVTSVPVPRCVCAVPPPSTVMHSP